MVFNVCAQNAKQQKAARRRKRRAAFWLLEASILRRQGGPVGDNAGLDGRQRCYLGSHLLGVHIG